MAAKILLCFIDLIYWLHASLSLSYCAKVCDEEEVLELDAQSLGDLLGLDDLNISQEQVVLELVLRWVQRRSGDVQSESEAVQLLRRVRLELVDPGFLRKARRRNPVRDERKDGLCITLVQILILSRCK